MSTLTIESITIQIKSFRLKKPYVLSFATLSNLDSVQVTLTLNDGTSRIAEVVPLVGYSDESTESISRYLELVKESLIHLSLQEARTRIEKDIPQNPFACSAILTAIDLFNWNLDIFDSEKIDLVVPATSENPDELLTLIQSIHTKGGGTIKIKLSGKINTDLHCLSQLNKFSFQNIFYRFDANKAFSLEDATSFYASLEKAICLPQVQYVEQPLGVKDWSGHQLLIEKFKTIHTLLDESIVTESDAQKSLELGCGYVKLKLFKQGGIKELIHLAKFCHLHKMKVVLGNGVATALSNDIENSIYLTYSDYFYGASEANGYLKLAAQ